MQRLFLGKRYRRNCNELLASKFGEFRDDYESEWPRAISTEAIGSVGYLAANPPIPGWFSDEDVWLFSILDQLQAAAGVRGDLLEIGGYLGKSAVALGYMLRQEETLVVVDPWDSEISDAENAGEQARLYPEVTFDRFKVNFQRFHTGLPDMRRGISGQCLPGLDSARYRFIHVDGSHEWEQVKGDVDQVVRLLAPNGVVAFDDMQAPGVGAAVWPACASGDLIPIATTGKLYATVNLMGRFWLRTLARPSEASLPSKWARVIRFFGQRCWR